MSMQPNIVNGIFLMCESNEDCYWTPEDAVELGEGIEISAIGFGFFNRWSMPGYLDCSEWDGPFKTELDAMYDLYQNDTAGNDLLWENWLEQYELPSEWAKFEHNPDNTHGDYIELNIAIPVR
ncbi:MAG: hypothetical protein DRI46_08045 [Chloroflexi bacterium]|nr:MAG: hypothetical protein DRI46_08045 [Chloroflexota bacterium]